MGIVQAPAVLPGQVGVLGAIKYMVTTDNLATITTAGYLNAIDLAVNPIFSSDVLSIQYSYNVNTNHGTFGLFTVSISNGVITLTNWANPGDVLLPVVSGDFANFNGTTGQIKDSGFSPSNAAKTKVVMANGTTVANHIGTFTDTTGTLGQDAATAINLGNIQAGDDTTKGQLLAYGGSSNGHIIINPIGNTGNTAITIQNAIYGQATVLTIPDPGAATANFVLDTTSSGQTISTSTSSATPGTLRALIGSMTESATTMTSGNVVGVRGVANMVGASGGFIYGTQGKVIATGTLSGSEWTAGIFGQLDISAATINAGQAAPIWGDYGSSSGTLTDQTGLYGIAMTNTTAAVLAGQLYLYGGATTLMLLNTNAGLSGVTYFKDSGVGAGSWGNATPPTPSKVLTISVDGTLYYLPLVAQNT